MEYVFLGLISCVLGLFIIFSGPAAFIWLFQVRKQLRELLEQNAELKSTLRRIQHDISTNRSDSPLKSGIITIETEERAGDISPPTQALQPIRPAAPIVPFAVAPTPPAQSAALDSGIYKRFEESGIISAQRTTADWSKSTDSSTPSVVKSAEKSEKVEWQSLELFIGQKLFGWIAVVGFIVAAALFIQYAVTMGWVTNVIKVLAIAAFGAALLGVGFYSRRTGLQRFSTMMSSAGIILIYQAGYASYAFYNLISLTTASILMPIIVFGGFLLAWLYRSKLLGIVSIIGGLAVPILVTSGEDRHIELFLYLMSLNIGTLILVNLLRRAPIAWIAFFGTQVLFWMWHTKFLGIIFYPHLDDPYPVHKLVAALVFQGVFYLVFLSDTVIAALKPIGKRLRPTWDDAMRAVLTPIVFFGAIFVMSQKGGIRLDVDLTWFDLHPSQRFLYDWLGIFAFIGAAWYALLAVLYSRHLGKTSPLHPWGERVRVRGGESAEKSGSPHPSPLPKGEGTTFTTLPAGEGTHESRYWQAAPSAAVVIALGFVAIGIPLQFSATWIALGWLTVFAGLWYFGHRQVNKTFIVMAYIFFGLGIIRFFADIVEQHAGVQTYFTPVFNGTALPLLACAGVLMVAAVLVGRFVKRPLSTHWGERVRVRGGESAEKSGRPHPSPLPEGEGTVAWGLNYVFGILGYILLGLILSGEAARYLHGHATIWEPYSAKYIFPAFLLGFWFALAVILLEIGYFFRSKVITTAGIIGLGFVTMMMFVGFEQRCVYREAFNNPFSIVLIAQSLILLAIGYQSKFVSRHSRAGGNPDDGLGSLDPRLREGVYGIFGVVGLFTLLVILTIEWFNYWFAFANAHNPASTFRSVTVFWSVYAILWITVGFAARNLPIRVCGMIILFAALAKTIFLDSTFTFGYCSWAWKAAYSLENWTLLINPYFLTMLCPVIPALALAVWTNSSQSYDCGSDLTPQERTAWKTAGIIGLVALLLYLSVECYRYFDVMASTHAILGTASLTLFWTVAASMLILLALWSQSQTLRIIAMALLLTAVLKVLLLDMWFRPEYVLPIWNPYSFPMLVLAVMLIALACLLVRRLDEDSIERTVYRFITFAAVVFLWLTMSVECYRSVQLQRAAGVSLPVAQMALSILWSLFAGVLIGIGFIWRSATLRWMAIILFATTLLKILIVDMSGVNELYRFGAVFALASLLALATWAYQRFKPER